MIFPPHLAVRCVRRGSSFIPAAACWGNQDLLRGKGAGPSWDPSYRGTGKAKDDYFSPLREFRRGAELGCFMSFCKQDQIWSGCCTALYLVTTGFVVSHERTPPLPKQQQYNNTRHCHGILLPRLLRCLADDMDSCNLTSPLRGSKVNAIKKKKNGRDKWGNGEIKLPEQRVQAHTRNQGLRGSFPLR